MANTNQPFGFRWLGMNNGSAAPTMGLIRRKIAYNDTQAAYRGDAIKNLSTGYVSAVTGTGIAASQYAGIFWGCEYLSTALGRKVVSPYWPGADTTQDVEVLLIPTIGSSPQLFVAQVTSTAAAFADIGLNVDIATGTPLALGGFARSGMTVDMSTKATTVTLPFRIQGLYADIAAPNAPGTEAASYNWVLVSSNSAGETGV